MTVTVLGASGFIGRRLVRALQAAGADVFAPRRGDPDIFTRPLGQVYFCIGMTADFSADPAATFDSHAAVLVRLLRDADFERIIYLSSTRLYDGLAEGDEAAPLSLQPTHPRHLYDLTKATGEHFALMQSGGRGMAVRLGCVYDNSDDATGFLPQLLRRLPAEPTIALDSSPDAARDYIHVDDTVAALQAVMAKGTPGTIYNLASGENCDNACIADMLAAHGGWHISYRLAAGKAAPAPLIHIDRLRALGVTPRRLADFIQSLPKPATP